MASELPPPGALAFLSSRADANLWSVALDATSGIARGPLRRMTRAGASRLSVGHERLPNARLFSRIDSETATSS